MSQVPADLRFTRSHEWVRLEADGTVAVGISHHAQNALGDIVFVELPKTGVVVPAGETLSQIESTEGAADIYAPVGGKVIKVNTKLESLPRLLNSEPYAAWLFRLEPSDRNELDSLDLLDAASYKTAYGE
ncbi:MULTISPECIES: glycine cleavage system protein GcvH [unclassified Streptomyces]|uniref:glycine cleavage system protein GcvH n=1 Tax=unclassified Streptomyces TaxID=2593676 RepID=UPI0006AFC2A9|nr:MULTISPECIES: glycine cleavage system protein GcvH [unclassified Streptomyces]KOV14741.1 glycine cleavage system protein H [Streptomyces sp. XY413]KOV31994.1 glycine cleavage system protein H [Streptomyces sp. H021]